MHYKALFQFVTCPEWGVMPQSAIIYGVTEFIKLFAQFKLIDVIKNKEGIFSLFNYARTFLGSTFSSYLRLDNVIYLFYEINFIFMTDTFFYFGTEKYFLKNKFLENSIKVKVGTYYT